ncbi:hypothetical protein COEREDRAFT_102753 [Coemansia reversa NRRL 1564]|uniref:Uncharacterized protein n=1 Tax=Coemansia reversa (strain ATCC 12441 / NRRL 1564) TaxID=763665 RepID=A0A2G5B9M0_COERN|nr:hypothetical protein COEREDRAFT_102753 [Coemansia reversa NRRL 1564]|eukprot:PIA15705.1 hypothetical protein COEREDRAFT_102753 [Coemansia reversa NRRL 1564]
MTGPKMTVRIPEQLDTFYAVLTHASNPQSPSSSEFSAGITDGETMVAVTDGTEYIWTPPALDPKYWEHVAKARKVHQTVAELKQGLTQKQKLGEEEEAQKLHREVRARERKLLRIIDQYILDYDDVVRVKKDEKHKASGNSSVELGTITPPVSPDMMPDRPLPPLPPGAEEEKQRMAAAEVDQQKRLAEAEKKLAIQAKKQRMGAGQLAESAQRTQPQSKQLPPPPPKAGNLDVVRRNNSTAAALDSQGFINSYKKHERYANSDARRDVSGETQEKPKARQLLWTGLFGSRNVRPLGTITTRRRSGSAEDARPNPTANRTRLGSPSSSSSLAQHVRGKSVYV